jgi:catechol 2,3-dioxygenase-like lactoylglutathione lyase family enzyme
MGVESISAVTLAVADMARSVVFYRDHVGLELLYGGETASFTSFRVAGSYINLMARDEKPQWWGRLIFHVDDVDAHYLRLTSFGLTPSTAPADAPWGERYFHIDDPDGHELSFAKLLPQGRSS